MRKILLYIIVILLSICTYLSISYAYYSVNPTTATNMATNVLVSGCISLSVSNTISITGDMAIPINDAKALSSDDYRVEFTVHNRCTTAQEIQVAFAPGAANTMPATALKYAMYEQAATAPTAGTVLSTNEIPLALTVISDVAKITGDTVSVGYLIADSITLAASSSKSYYAYLWIAKDEGGTSNSVINKVLKMHLVLGSATEIVNNSLASWLVYQAPKSGTDTVSSSPWILTSDHTGEWRYAGKNPDNYLSFNDELWRIIGVMPNMTYCTGTYGTDTECSTTATGSLVKIIRNDSIARFQWDVKNSGVGSSLHTYGSSDWSDSQLMLMLNGTNYLKTAYDINNTRLHTGYTVTNNIVADAFGHNFYNATYSYLDGSGTTVYKPSSATTSSYTATSGTLSKKIGSAALEKIATVKWDLYGTLYYEEITPDSSPTTFYNIERNIGGTGSVYTNTSLVEKRPAYWYGKIGLMYPSDYGYATNGGSTYNRATCLASNMYDWDYSTYKTDCASESYLWYIGTTSTVPSSGTKQFSLTPETSSGYPGFYFFSIFEYGYAAAAVGQDYAMIRPVLYLKTDTLYGGSGSGTYDSPYTIS